MDEDDDRAPDGIEGDFSVDPLRPAIDYLQHIMSGHESRFYRITGFNIGEWEVISPILMTQNELYKSFCTR